MTKLTVTTYYFDYDGAEVDREEEDFTTPEDAFAYMVKQAESFKAQDTENVFNDVESFPEDSPSKGEVIARFMYAPVTLVDDDDQSEIYMELSILNE